MGCPPNPGADFCPFAAASVAFAGTARSVDFGGSLNDVVFDNLAVGAAPAVVPEPAAVSLLGAGLLGVAGAGALRRRRATPHGDAPDACTSTPSGGTLT